MGSRQSPWRAILWIRAVFNCQWLLTPLRAKAVQFTLYPPAAWQRQVVSRHAVQTLCRPTWDTDVNMEGKHQITEQLRPALWMNWKPALYFPDSLNINLLWVEQNWAICQPSVHHASLILSLCSLVCICVFTSIFTHTEHAGTSGQAVEQRVSLMTIGLLGLGKVAMGGQGTCCFLGDTDMHFCAVGTSTAVTVWNILLQTLSFGGKGTLDAFFPWCPCKPKSQYGLKQLKGSCC